MKKHLIVCVWIPLRCDGFGTGRDDHATVDIPSRASRPVGRLLITIQEFHLWHAKYRKKMASWLWMRQPAVFAK